MNDNQEILLTVGSGGEVTNMHVMGNDPVKREAYVKELVEFAKANNFDGIDIDWETNWKVEPYQYVPTNNLIALLKSIKEQMPNDAILSAALGRSRASAQQACDISEFVEDVSVMLYGALNNEGLHSPLYTVIENLENFKYANYPNNELLVGVPFYGMREDKNTIKYKNIVNNLPPGDTSVSIYDGYSFNSVEDMHVKVRYLINEGYKGVMIWETTQDVPYSNPMSLLHAIYEEVNKIE
jgi:GH18 family chitinase